MASLLEFMYRGEVQISQERLSSFLKTADNLQVKIMILYFKVLYIFMSVIFKFNFDIVYYLYVY